MARELHDAALRREVAAQDREPARGLERRLHGDDDLLAVPLDGCRRDLAERAAVDVRRVAVDEPRLRELARDERDAAGLVHVGGDEAAAGLQARDDGRPLGDRGRSPRARRGCWSSRAIASRWRTPFVEPPVAAIAAVAFSSASRVTISEGRTPFRTRSIASRPACSAASFFVGSSAGIPLRPPGLMPRNSSAVDIVFAVNWPPQAPAPGHATLSSSCRSAASSVPCRVRARPPRRRPGSSRPGPGTGPARSSRCRGRARAGRAGRAP